MLLLHDKATMVTGAARGIGRAIAEAFAEQGADVVLGDLLVDEARQVAAHISATTGRRALALRVDVRDPASVQALVDATVAWLGRIDVLVNNAGIHRPHLVTEFPLAAWEEVFATNVRGTFLCAQAVARVMIQRGQGGCIINMSSASGKKPDMRGAAYCASKSAVIGLTRVLALELGQYGIRANAVLPGATDTQLLHELTRDLPGYDKQLVAITPLGKMATPRDQANAAVYLASELASHVTGAQLVVSGGEFMDG